MKRLIVYGMLAVGAVWGQTDVVPEPPPLTVEVPEAEKAPEAVENALTRARRLRKDAPVEALAAYAEAVRDQPRDAQLRLEYAALLAAREQPALAAQEAFDAWLLEPTADGAERLVAWQLQAGMTIDAAISAELALERFPDAAALRIIGAQALAAAGRGEAAAAVIEALDDKEAATPESLHARALALVAADRPVEAWKMLDDLDPKAAVSVRHDLQRRALAGPGVLFFPPSDWRPAGGAVSTADGTVTMRWQGPREGELMAVAKEAAADRFAEGAGAWLLKERPEDEAEAAGIRLETREVVGGGIAVGLTLALPVPEGNEAVSLTGGVIALPTAAGIAVLGIDAPMDAAAWWPLVELLSKQLVITPERQE